MLDLSKCLISNPQRTEERKVAIAVRAHPTIELLEDRLYVVTCGRAGFQVISYHVLTIDKECSSLPKRSLFKHRLYLYFKKLRSFKGDREWQGSMSGLVKSPFDISPFFIKSLVCELFLIFDISF